MIDKETKGHRLTGKNLKEVVNGGLLQDGP